MFGKKVISIDIGTNSIKTAVGKHQNKIVFVEKAFDIPTPKGAYEDGSIVQAEMLREVIFKALKEKKIRTKEAIFTVASTSTIIREIVVPFVKNQDLKSMVHLEIEQYLPIRLEDYVVEYKVLEEIMEEDSKKLRILVAALPKEIIGAYYDLLKDLKLHPLVLDIHTNAVSKLFEREMQINDENYSLDKTVALIDFGHSFTNINIVSGGLLKFYRKIPVGGNDLTTNIANYYNLSLEEAEARKIQDSNLELHGNTLDYPTMINELIKSDVDQWIEEIGRIFRYYTSRKTENHIDSIYIYGGTSKIKALPQYIERGLNISTFKVEALGNVKLSKELNGKEIDIFLNSIGSIFRR